MPDLVKPPNTPKGPHGGARPKSGQRLKALADLIHETGLDPTEWEFRRWCENVRLLEEMKAEYIDKELPGRILDMEADLLREARTWREYRIPKQRSVDANIYGDMNYTLLDALQERKTREQDEDDGSP